MKSVIIVLCILFFIIIMLLGGILLITIWEDDDKLVKGRIWSSRKRNCLGLPWTFTVYSFDKECFYLDTGILNKRQDELRLYRILDITVTRSFGQRIFGMGSILINSSDKSLKDFKIKNIKDVLLVRGQLSQLVENNREEKHVMSREFISDSDDDDIL